ncbi:UV radiation resistance protein and autophagy-related subunit 14-domain-containing protein [Amylocystis lapponica]|nr:UV radiation resistance protein and autophagy-related subunit 14-domain-containing protein [Amylocystis lapponica]
MECQNCELRQRQFYCENCLKQHLLSIRLQTTHLSTDRDNHIASAQRALTSTVDPARLRRADLKSTEERVRELWEGVDSVRTANEKTRECLRTLRNNISSRRRTLAIATSTFLPHSTSAASTSASPPHAYTSPLAHYTPSSSPQSARPFAHRRGSSSFSSTSATPPSGTPIRAPSRAAHPPSPAASPLQPISAASGPEALSRQIDEAAYQLTALSDTLVRARSGLVQELVEVFSVVEVGGRPPLGGKAGTKGEWTIGGLVLPVPGDMRRYPPDHINAVLTHTLHFLILLAFYLGVKLPFEVVWSRSSTPPASSPSTPSPTKGNGLLGVGTPWIGACKGGESGGWARWSNKHPLHVSSSAQPAAASTSPSPARAGSSSSPLRPGTKVRAVSSPTPSASRHLEPSPSLADSQLEEPPGADAAGGSFTTALAMLLYDVCYLAHTQAVDVPLAQAGEVLSNLWAVCCSTELGRKSHATYPLLPAPTPPAFALDFAQLLQATVATPARARARGVGALGGAVRPAERIVEEEEGWDLVNDAE